MQAKNILLIQTAFLGDVILTTPMIAALKKTLPHARLSVLTKQESAVLLEHHPAVDEVIAIDKKKKHRGIYGMFQMIKGLRRRKFDLLLSPHRSHRTSLLSFFSNVPVRIGYAESGFSYLGYHRCLHRDFAKPEIDRLLIFLKDALEISSVSFDRRPSIQVSERAMRAAKDILSSKDARKPIVIAPSSAWPTKRWLPGGFAVLIGKLIKEYRRSVFLVGSKEDKEVCQRVMRLVAMFQSDEIKERVHDISGKLSIDALYAFLEQSFLLVSNDSAPVHLACAANIPVVAVFGPTVPELGYAPLTQNSAVVQKELGCRPCGLHGHRECPEKHFRCMKELSPLDVLEAVRKIV